MSEKRFKKMDMIIDPFPIWDTVEEKGYNCTDTLDVLVDLLNELFEHNLHLQRLIESLEKYTGESIEDTIARCQEKKEIYTTSKRPMRFVGGRKV